MASEVTKEVIKETKAALNALELIDAAIALGARIPSPVGCILYILSVNLVDGDDARNNYSYIVGAYQSKESAEAALRNWVLERWEMTERAPWIEDFEGISEEYNEKERLFLAEHIDSEVIKEYFENSLDSYEISEEEVKKFSKRSELEEDE